jgi:hypothetical protein
MAGAACFRPDVENKQKQRKHGSGNEPDIYLSDEQINMTERDQI